MIYVAVLLLALSRCAPMAFERITATNTLEQDTYDCRVELGIIASPRGRPGQEMAQLAFVRGEMQQCMERRGWKRVDG